MTTADQRALDPHEPCMRPAMPLGKRLPWTGRAMGGIAEPPMTPNTGGGVGGGGEGLRGGPGAWDEGVEGDEGDERQDGRLPKIWSCSHHHSSRSKADLHDASECSSRHPFVSGTMSSMDIQYRTS